MSSTWRGHKYSPGAMPGAVPPMPGTHPVAGDHHGRAVADLEVVGALFDPSKVPGPTGNPRPRAPAVLFDGGPFARVRLTGEYGNGGFQSLLLAEVTRDEALAAAWTWFGLGQHTVSYRDARDNVLAEE